MPGKFYIRASQAYAYEVTLLTELPVGKIVPTRALDMGLRDRQLQAFDIVGRERGFRIPGWATVDLNAIR